ncbi:MAG TPA: NAD(P)-binding domain-containing protein [Actinomycetes bacterium]|nr:NAD(P)-binding domain-containing protein [Actinomycetes bacterium]
MTNAQEKASDRPNIHGGRRPERVDTVVIGGGQCGLAVGYYLKKQPGSFVILDENQRTGDCWRRRYDSLRLYSPARVDGLPGMRFPGSPRAFPTGGEMAEYLATYAREFELPIRFGVHVTGVRRPPGDQDSYLVTGPDCSYEASNVVIATGGQHLPYVPEFAGQLDPDIRQFHSSDYRNPSQLQDGGVLIVGASHSGADLAMECAPGHRTWLAGRDRGQFPFALEGRAARLALPVLWFAANHVLTVRTPPGRKMRGHVRSEGGPLLRYKREDLAAAGVERTEERVVGVRDGKPVLEGGEALDVANVVWCTGFRHDFSWIDLPLLDETGWPSQTDGESDDNPGLFFAGLIFQFSFASMLVGGAARDARVVAARISTRSRNKARQLSVA